MKFLKRFFKLSPFLLIAIAIASYCLFMFVYDQLKSPEPGWGLFFLIYGGGIALLVLFIDVVMKIVISAYRWVLIPQAIVVVLMGFLYINNTFSLQLILPKEFHVLNNEDQKYALIIYNVEEADPLPGIGQIGRSEVLLPPNGVLLTSSTPYRPLGNRQWKLKQNNGELFSLYSTFPILTFQVNNQEYAYQLFKLEPPHHCCGYSGTEMDESKKIALQRFLDLQN